MHYFKRHIIIFFSIVLISNSLCSQVNLSKSANESLVLEVYADSLKNLLLGHRTTKTLLIADSLLTVNRDFVSPEIVRIKAAKANAYELQYNFEAALEIYNELIVILETRQYIDEEIDVYLSLARVYEWIDKPELCQESLDRALNLIELHAKPEKLSRYYVRSASYQRIFKDRALGKEYARKGVQLGEQYSVYRSIADGSLILGILTDDFEESINHFKRASDEFENLGDFIGSKFQDLNIARRYTRIGDYNKAVNILKDVRSYSETIDDNDRIYYQFKIRLAEVYERIFEKKDEKDSLISALRQNSKYTKLLGNLVNQDIVDQLVFDNTIRQERQKLEAAKKSNNQLGLGFAALLGLLGFLSVLYAKNRNQAQQLQKQSEVIAEQFQKTEKLYKYQTTLLSEVHHRIKNNLQLINSLLTLQKAKSVNKSEGEMLDVLNHRVSSISLIHEQLYNTKEFDKIDVDLYVKNLLNNFSALISEKNIVIKHNVDELSLNLETITPLGLIWSELISNSIKYNTEKSDLEIFLKLVQDGLFYDMQYSDNGIGYPEEKFESNEKGMGHIIINSLSRQLAAEAESFNQSGAHFHMRFKEKNISPL